MTDKAKHRVEANLDDDSYSELEENDQMASNLEESKSIDKEPAKKVIQKAKRNSAVRDAANNSIQTNKTYSVNQD